MGVHVQPEVLQQAAKGINGVIDGLSGTPVIGAYAGQTVAVSTTSRSPANR